MKPASLSMRLGLTVSILGALLVVFLAILAYFALTHELNTLSRDGLEKKMEQVEHSLSLYDGTGEISGKPHILLDQVMGHDNLTLTIYDRLNLRTPLLKSGSGLSDPRVELKAVRATTEQLIGWSKETHGSFSVDMLAGGHFFIHEHEARVLRVIKDQLDVHHRRHALAATA